MSHAASLLPLALLACTTGCRSVDGGCDLSAEYGLSITVHDAETGGDLCAATVTAQDGAFVETLRVEPIAQDAGIATSCSFVGAAERPGTYTLVVAAPGFHTVMPPPVNVPSGDCHVVGQSVVVALSPS